MNRRDLFKCLAAGGMVIAGELWIPGQKLISIPKTKELWFFGEQTIEIFTTGNFPGILWPGQWFKAEYDKYGAISHMVKINYDGTTI